jgi:thiol-disulfide isomerase/thioredoxin
MKLVPTQKGIDYSRPTADEVGQCKVSAQKAAGAVGWVVEDPRGAILRRFLDTNGDGRIDQWCYYKDGLEVYRDVDSDFDGKVDQCRWFNTAGTRWGIDRDQDGTIDSWKAISAEEVTQEVVAALAKQDSDQFARVLLSQEELRSLGLGETKSAELAAKINTAAAKFKTAAAQQKTVTGDTKWIQFSGSRPGIVPAGTDGSAKDLEVYEGVAAIVQTGTDHGQLQVGTLVKAGHAWRVIDAPQANADTQNDALAHGFFFRTSGGNRPQAAAGAPNEKAQAILGELEKLDGAVSRAAGPEEQAQLNAKRADLLEQLAAESGKPEDRAAWIRQLADTVSAAVQSGGYPKGAKRLESLWERLGKEDDGTLAGYVRFRQLTAEYGLAVQANKGNDFAKVQSEWLKKLEQFVADYPKSPDAAEAMLQLAIAQEFAGQEEEAKKWYGNIGRDFPGATVAKKAAGAKIRLDSVGKVIDLQGKSPSGDIVELTKYRGKAVLIQYWATWCEPCKADMVVLRDLLEKHGGTDFAVIGVNLDSNSQAVSSFLSEHKLPWPQVYEDGGLDSRPALEMGILTLPTMILVDREGKVINRNVSASELAAELKKIAR